MGKITKPLTREEIFSKVKGASPRKFYDVKWITDQLPVTVYKDPTTGEATTITVTVVAKSKVRFNVNYARLKSVVERGELAARTKKAGTTTVISRKREPWWKHLKEAKSLCYHKNDETLSEDSRRWYIQMFAASKRARDASGKFVSGSTKITPELEYIFMMGTPDEEVIHPGTPENDKMLKTLSTMRPAHEKPQEVWFKPMGTILEISHK